MCHRDEGLGFAIASRPFWLGATRARHEMDTSGTAKCEVVSDEEEDEGSDGEFPILRLAGILTFDDTGNSTFEKVSREDPRNDPYRNVGRRGPPASPLKKNFGSSKAIRET